MPVPLILPDATPTHSPGLYFHYNTQYSKKQYFLCFLRLFINIYLFFYIFLQIQQESILCQKHAIILCYNDIMFFEVIPTEVYREGGGALTYSFDHDLLPGHLVLIPLGRRTITGIVLKKVPRVDFPTKSIIRLIHPIPLPNHLLKSILWLSKYYLSPLPACANLLLPAGLTSRTSTKAIEKSCGIATNIHSVKDRFMSSSLDRPQGNNPRERHASPVTTKMNDVGSEKESPKPNIKLNLHQQQALQALSDTPGSTRLLRGVTGSGKTNIYLKMASGTLTNNQSVILLVPEIALTSQLVKIFEQTFGNRVILIHSNQTLVERRSTWLKLLTETSPHGPKPLVVIGPRSALLAPLANLGLIMIDESHESAYYQENPPRYSAIRLASFIAKTLNIPCIQGTATPNIVDFHLAKTHHSLVELSEKAKSTAITPEITIVDFKERANFLKNRYFSNQLLTTIEKNLQAKHQTLIFHNRRGSSPLTICEECGWQALCPECYLPMTLHADGYLLTCHICGHEEKVPSSCPNCHHPGIVHKGFGTKLLESELTRLFPKAQIARFDGDNKNSDNLANLYQEVKTGKIDLLIGTQTLARGLDLPLLASVGIIQADAGLSLPDFSAEERTFELLTQVIGRVGRGHLNHAEVVVQTFQPEHPVIKTALQADYLEFAKYLLQKRHQQQLPPYTYLALLSITYKTEKTTLAKIRSAHSLLSQNPKLTVSPPMPSFHERTNRGYTWQIVIKSSSRETLREALLPFSRFHIELDPPSLL